jgi:AcrR family transcriptional regulator
MNGPKSKAKRAVASDLRGKIVEVIVDVLANQGIEALSFELVASSLKMSRQNLFYYFKSRDEMIEAAVMASSLTGQQETIAALKLAKTAQQQLMAVIDAAYAWQIKYPSHARVYALFYYLSTFDPRYRNLLDRAVGQARQRLMDILSDPAMGGSRSGLVLSERAAMIHSVIFGRSVYSLLNVTDSRGGAQYVEQTKAMVGSLAQF